MENYLVYETFSDMPRGGAAVKKGKKDVKAKPVKSAAVKTRAV